MAKQENEVRLEDAKSKEGKSEQKFNKSSKSGKRQGKKFSNRTTTESKPDFSEEVGKPGNDPKWWKRVPELLINAVNIKPNYLPGTVVTPVEYNFVPAGLLKYDLRFAFGSETVSTGPINVWARDLYLRMFQKYRGISAYSAADLGIITLAGIQVVAMIAKLERIYGTVNRYSKANLNIPHLELFAMGLSIAQADWIRGHLADYRYDLNLLIAKAQRLCIPKDMTILADYVSLFGYEYLDHDSPKSQIVMADSDRFFVFSDTHMTTGSSLVEEECTMSSTNVMIDITGTADNMFVFLDRMIDALVGSTSVQKVYGDLLAWFGDGQLLRFAPIQSDYIIYPWYNESILHKFHNIDPIYAPGNRLVTVGDTALNSSDQVAINGVDARVIYQLNDVIHSKFCMVNAASPTVETVGNEYVWCDATEHRLPSEGPTIFDSYHADFNEDVVVEAAIFKFTVKHGTSNSKFYNVVASCGFYICTGTYIYNMTALGTPAVSSKTYTVGSNAQNAYSEAAQLGRFDWCPLVFQINSNATGNIVLNMFGDYDNLVPVYPDTKRRIARAIVASGLFTEIKVLDSIKN